MTGPWSILYSMEENKSLIHKRELITPHFIIISVWIIPFKPVILQKMGFSSHDWPWNVQLTIDSQNNLGVVYPHYLSPSPWPWTPDPSQVWSPGVVGCPHAAAEYIRRTGRRPETLPSQNTIRLHRAQLLFYLYRTHT